MTESCKTCSSKSTSASRRPEPSYGPNELMRENKDICDTIDCDAADIFSSTTDLVIREIIRSGKYFIDAYHGKIYNSETMREIGYLNTDGYMYIKICYRKMRMRLPIHRIVYLYIHPEYTAPRMSVIHHIDGNKTNNAISNLMPMTNLEHRRHHVEQRCGGHAAEDICEDFSETLDMYDRIANKKISSRAIDPEILVEYLICMSNLRKHSYGRGIITREFCDITGLRPNTLQKYCMKSVEKESEFSPEEIEAVLEKYGDLIRLAQESKYPNQYTCRGEEE